jgi:hypothetical protein
MESELNSLDTFKSTSNPIKGKSLVTKAAPSPSNQRDSQDKFLQFRTVPGPSDANGLVTMVTCPLCGSEAVAEKCRLDIHKLSGQTSARKYLRFRVKGARKTLDKLLQAEVDLEEKFVQAEADKKQHKIAVLKSWTSERLAQAKLSKVEAEKSKAKTVHYQDPMDVHNDEPSASTEGSPVLKESPALAGNFIKISTKESQEIWKSHMVVGSRTAPLHKKFRKPGSFFLLPHPPSLNLCCLSSVLR